MSKPGAENSENSFLGTATGILIIIVMIIIIILIKIMMIMILIKRSVYFLEILFFYIFLKNVL